MGIFFIDDIWDEFFEFSSYTTKTIQKFHPVQRLDYGHVLSTHTNDIKYVQERHE